MDKPGKKNNPKVSSAEVLRRKKPAEKEQPSQEAPSGPDNNAVSVKEGGPIYFKGQLNLKELKFLEAFLSGECSIDQAMVAAGYGSYHMRSRYRRARAIIEKYERGARGAREVMRACGVGEVRVVKKIDALMDAPSDRTQLGATELAAKCLGMAQEQRGPSQGIQIVIHTALAPASGEPLPGPPVVEVQETKRLPPQTKPLQITK